MGEPSDRPAKPAGSGAAWPHDPMLWPYAATKLAMDSFFWWAHRGSAHPAPGNTPPLPWTTPNKVALELTTMRLRDFSQRHSGQPVLICGPFALHTTLIADFAPGHSIIERLQQSGLDRVFLTDWRSASPDMRYLAIDQYLADLNVAVDEIGYPVDLIGLCQGGWLSLVYAARFPEKVRRLVLAGTPVDLSVDSGLARLVGSTPQAAFEGIVESGGGIVKGEHILRLWSRASDTDTVLQRNLSQAGVVDQELLARFMRWHDETVDLPGTYFLQVVGWIFRENRIANGTFVALGRAVRPGDVKVPVFLLAGSDDEIVPAPQAMATASRLGTPAIDIERAVVPSSHLGLYLGSQTLAVAWPRIAGWLQADRAVPVAARL
ncbi:alpha/beta fold hydrolase [Bradyrhizobium sp.]|uniref:alpha/beta fold hydrolase n=1 Tax=Bradyrhizobium sp. TaxID=376 RepID=UPI001DD0A116|nr:alpha/beta fold hydrolase [Bradyrhizobium sp.]MBI5318983.1 alpha/beta hydrolase [Bradyrhizobium sp.]